MGSPCLFRLSSLHISIHAPRVGSDSYPNVRWLLFDISIHAPRVGSDLHDSSLLHQCIYFNPRSPCGERRISTDINSAKSAFQSTLPVWGATDPFDLCFDESRFQSTLPVWGATNLPCILFYDKLFQSTLPVWGATLALDVVVSLVVISIHAPRVGSDFTLSIVSVLFPYFNPRSPCGERQNINAIMVGKILFQSTLPVWGATENREQLQGRNPDFNPRSPCGERQDVSVLSRKLRFQFQSTLPVWGATKFSGVALCKVEFQSTLPVWGATKSRQVCIPWYRISIHAPRVGSDRSIFDASRVSVTFQSTLPVWGATRARRGPRARLTIISIHAPRVGSDFSPPPPSTIIYHFNPRSPCGERLFGINHSPFSSLFQSTLPVWGATVL